MSFEELRAIPGMASNRAATLPDAAALLAALVNIIDVPEMTVSSSGLREGLLYQALDPATRAQDPLIVAAEFEGRRLARFAPHGRAIAEWIAPLFANEEASDSRIRLAASLLSDVAWSANPDFRAERGTEIGLHGNWRSIDIPGRILLARALHAGFGGADVDFPAMTSLVPADRIDRARQWGLAIRLAQRLTGGVEAPLKASAIALDDGKLRLSLDPGWHHLAGESVDRRLRALAQAFGVKPELVLLYNEAYVELMGDKHPALGRRCDEVFPEAMDAIGPLLAQVRAGGEATWSQDVLLPLQRAGYVEDCWFTWSYSAVLGPDGEVEGIVDIAVETTAQVLARRRSHLVAQLLATLEDAVDEEDVVARTRATLDSGQDLGEVALPFGAAPGSGLTLETGGDPSRGVLCRVEVPGRHAGTPPRHLEGRLSPRLPLDGAYTEFLRTVAAGVGAALDSVAAAESQRAISEALQRSLLTQPQPGHALEVAVRYQPASQQARVGGDWYDCYPLPDGAVTVMVGDVAGHDQTAAAAMGQLRNLARGVAYSADVWLPSQVLQDLDLAMEGLGMEGVATALVAVLEEQGPDGQLVHWANAGHPPPVLVRADGVVRLLDVEAGLLLGLDPSIHRADHRLELAPGDLLLLYTDGLVERRGADLDDGLSWLVETVTAHAHLGPEELCDVLLRESLTHDDDQVLLAVRARGLG